MMTRKAVLFLLLCQALVTCIYSQQSQYNFEKFPNDMMLSQCPITAILQDHRGFIWIGTWSGLIQFDGYNIRHYRQQPDNANGLESNKIIALFEDSQQRLWVGSQNSGFYLYDRSRDFFVRYGKDADDMNSLSNNNVWAIYEDSYGLLWIGTEGGLNFFNPETGRFIHLKKNPDDARSISFDFVYSICETSDGSLWIATEQGLNRLVRHGNHEPDYLIRYSLAPEGTMEGTDEFVAHNYIYKIRPVKNSPNTLWAGTKEGLKKLTLSANDINTLDIEEYKYNPEDPSSLSHNFVVDMWEDDSDGLWVATFGGLNVRKPGENTFTRLHTDDTSPGHFSSNIVKALYHDRSNVLWIGTEGGMRKLDLEAKPFETLRPGGQSVTSIVKSSVADGIWTGTRGGGIYFVSTDNNQPRTIHPNYHVSAGTDVSGFISDLVLDKHGSLWMTTLGAGLIMMQEDEALRMKNPPVKQFSINGNLDLLGEEHLMSVIESPDNGLWISTWDDGVIRYDIHTGRFKRFMTTRDFEVSLSSFPVVHLEITEEDGRYILWAGTRGNGLVKLFYNPSSQTLELLRHDVLQLDDPESLSSNFINVLFTDRSNRLWVGTENGLNFYDES